MGKFGKLMEVIDEAIEEAELEVGNAEANRKLEAFIRNTKRM